MVTGGVNYDAVGDGLVVVELVRKVDDEERKK